MTDQIRRLEDLLRTLPERMAETQRQAAEFAVREISAETADSSVTAIMTGDGRIVDLRLATMAVRQMDRVTLGERIAEAINNALDEVDRARSELLAEADDGTDALAAAEELFAHRIRALQSRLDAIQSSLDV